MRHSGVKICFRTTEKNRALTATQARQKREISAKSPGKIMTRAKIYKYYQLFDQFENKREKICKNSLFYGAYSDHFG
jgi:hypothetical protein